jgi:ABC-type phosphate/phosphonate transport system permease subunit
VLARALTAGKVLALLFYNPPATDDRAVKRELASVPTHKGRVLKLALPLNDLARYSVVTDQVPVMVSPTLVLINRNHQASTIVGFADRFEISQRVADALG